MTDKHTASSNWSNFDTLIKTRSITARSMFVGHGNYDSDKIRDLL